MTILSTWRGNGRLRHAGADLGGQFPPSKFFTDHITATRNSSFSRLILNCQEL